MKKYTITLIGTSIFLVSFYYIQIIIAFQNASLVYSHFSYSPLTSQIELRMPFSGAITTKVAAENPDVIPITYKKNYKKGDIALPVVGLVADNMNIVSLTYHGIFGIPFFSKEFIIDTTHIAGEWYGKNGRSKMLNVSVNKLGNTYKGLYGFTDNITFVDQKGYIRWTLQNDDFEGVFLKLRNGNFLVGSKKGKIMYHYKSFLEVDIFGNIIKKFNIPNMFHHEIIELDNGNLLTTSSSQFFSSLGDDVYREDTIIEIDRYSGSIVKTIFLGDILPDMLPDTLEKKSFILPSGEMVISNTGDWIHINSLFIDGQNLIISMKNKNAVLSMNYNSYKINWILGNTSNLYNSSKLFTLNVLNSQGIIGYQYPLSQHTALIQDNQLVLFDNGTNRRKYSDLSQEQGSRVLKYSIDHQNKTAELIDVYIHPENIYTPLTGNVQAVGDSYVIGYTFNEKSPSRITHINTQGEILFELVDTANNSYYRGIHMDITH